ncbi:hypothetical protein, partial [Stenotrophomonas maltophilia]|uniref:hypothetical protein n=1 Tax=Stenotrophomonas maltophilia TaxID=40324 RepID=UPI0013DBC069
LLIGALFFLFAFVFTVPLWVEPFLRAAQVGEGKDWIGFAGNVIGTLVAVLAAGTAWFIAQKQIATSRQQNAVVAYHAFSSVLDTIDVQIRICNSTHEALVAFNESLRDALLNINKSRTYGPGWT